MASHIIQAALDGYGIYFVSRQANVVELVVFKDEKPVARRVIDQFPVLHDNPELIDKTVAMMIDDLKNPKSAEKTAAIVAAIAERMPKT